MSLESAAMRVLLATIFIAIVGFGAAIWLRHNRTAPGFMGKKNGVTALLGNRLRQKIGDDIVITSSHRLMAGQTLVSVSWRGNAILLGCTNHSISVLSQQSEASTDVGEAS